MNQIPITIHVKDKKWILFDNDCGVSDVLRRGQIYEKNMFEFIKTNHIELHEVIDIGANLGNHSLHFADTAKKVHAFEPQRLIYYQLCGNVIINGYTNIITYNLALGDVENLVKMEAVDYASKKVINIGDTHINKFRLGEEVHQKRLDQFQFSNVTVIKLDVQGYEPMVIDGAVETIKAHRPIMFIEIEDSQLQIYGYNRQDIFNRMNMMGYAWHELPNGKNTDYVFLPQN